MIGWCYCPLLNSTAFFCFAVCPITTFKRFVPTMSTTPPHEAPRLLWSCCEKRSESLVGEDFVRTLRISMNMSPDVLPVQQQLETPPNSFSSFWLHSPPFSALSSKYLYFSQLKMIKAKFHWLPFHVGNYTSLKSKQNLHTHLSALHILVRAVLQHRQDISKSANLLTRNNHDNQCNTSTRVFLESFDLCCLTAVSQCWSCIYQ